MIEEATVRIRIIALYLTPSLGFFVTKNLNKDKQKLMEFKKHEK